MALKVKLPGSMRRGRAQVVHSYAPGKTFDYERGYCVARVVAISGSAWSTDERLQRLREAIWRRLHAWRGGKLGLPERHVDLERLFFVQPSKAFFEVWPLVYICTRCRRAERFESPKEMFKALSSRSGAVGKRSLEASDGQHRSVDVVKEFLCGACGARMEQSRYLLIHECGEADGLAPPPCPSCDGEDDSRARYQATPASWNVRLDEMGSERAADFRWMCNKCDRIVSDTVPHALPGRAGVKGRFRLLPHRANAAHYTHTVRAIRVADEHYAKYVKTEAGAKSIWEAYLHGRKPSDIATVVATDGASNPMVELLTVRLNDARARGQAAQVAVLEQLIEQELAHSASGTSVQNLPDDDVDLREELVEYTTLPLATQVRGLDQLVRDLEVSAPGSGYRAVLAKQRFASLGLAEVELVQGFEIFEASFGFTRGKAEGEDVVLRGFNIAAGMVSSAFSKIPGTRDVGYPCYLLPAVTEAIRVTLSPSAVVKWLTRLGTNGVPSPSAPVPELRRWLLEHTSRFGPFPTSRQKELDDRLFTLLHSVAHAVIRCLSGFSGLRTSSLSEYLFPRCLSAIVYVNKMSFNAGNLRAVCEQAIDRFAGALVNDPLFRVCPHDPLCLTKDGSCTACLHLADQTCGHANRFLDRAALYGGRGLAGFWEQTTE
jgi:hypothetical protein